ncbi:glycosyltransferase family 4 protein [Ancylomarina sp. 16SWW S1-10-2]|uniref:glycosyltransferase family 4 protein n=1 Tax=Ancylomarina sp. 16SWW S1-10-2 TaxID=2499681 RepID=UPI0012AE6C62|nr:glycosyltransferase family 4 protein [Ancylomarina sp. 16SWW S1-10-2]MRT93434.1 glycosyltransferase family 4 protein [Ancylomarina sp. 16SWW S1-10-2]
MKIVYCIGSLAKKGGTERVLANKANYFADKLGYEIHIFISDQKGLPFCYEFSKNIKFHDMATSQYAPKLVIKGISFFVIIRKLRKVYKARINKINPDVIIVCERGFDDFILPYICKSVPKVREFHFAKGAVKNNSKIIKPLIASLHYRFLYFLLFRQFNKYDYLILLTNKDQQEGNYKTNTVVIPNIVEFEGENRVSDLKAKSVISVGSMSDERKGFKKQIIIWKDIAKKHPEWILHLFGDGARRSYYTQLVDNLDLNGQVILHGSSDKMPDNYLSSSIFMFTSSAEGLPMVLLEAQSFGLPCISYDCPTGPSDIIEDGLNGFLIAENDKNEFIIKLEQLIENIDLRRKMGAAAVEKSKLFTYKNIVPKWESFFNSILKK